MKYETVQVSTEKSLIVIPTARKIAIGVKTTRNRYNCGVAGMLGYQAKISRPQ